MVRVKSAPPLTVAAVLLCVLLLPVASAVDRIPVPEAGPGKTVYIGDRVWLNGTASDDGSIILYEWDFEGDGRYDWRTNETGNASHVYNAAGVYNPVFRVTDDGNQSATDRTNVVVRSRNVAPYADAGGDRKGEAGISVAFNGTGVDFDGRISEYGWDFENDGVWDFNGATGNVSHIYNAPGVYFAVLMVTDNGTPAFNDTDLCQVTVYPLNQKPSANAGPALTAVAGETVVLAGKGFDPDGDISLYEWDLNGDGRWDWSSNATGSVGWRYFEPGTYVATLRVTDSAPIPASGVSSTSVKVTAKNRPPLIFGPSNQSANAGKPERFDVYAVDGDAGDSISRLGWDFDGNGVIDYYSVAGNATHAYGSGGTYRLKVTAFDTQNATANWTITVKVSGAPPAPGLIEKVLPWLLPLLAGIGIGVALGAAFMMRYMKKHWERFFKPTAYERMKMRSDLELEETAASGFRGLQPGDGNDDKYRDLGT